MKAEFSRGADPPTPRLVPQVMTAQEAAEVLNVSLSTIYNLRDRGTLPQLTKLPGVRFAAKDVMDLIGVDTYFYTPQKMKELQQELARKDVRIMTLEELLRRAATTIWEGLRRENEP